MNGRETVTYVVGEERRLTDLLRESEASKQAPQCEPTS